MNLRYDYIEAGMIGENRHAQTVMKELGITYKESIPQSIGDQWWFIGCENVLSELPEYLKEMEYFNFQRYS